MDNRTGSPAPSGHPGSMSAMLSSLTLQLVLAANPDDQTGKGATRHTELPMPPWAFGLIALALFTLGLLALWSFRNTAHQVEDMGDHGTATSTGHVKTPGRHAQDQF